MSDPSEVHEYWMGVAWAAENHVHEWPGVRLVDERGWPCFDTKAMTHGNEYDIGYALERWKAAKARSYLSIWSAVTVPVVLFLGCFYILQQLGLDTRGPWILLAVVMMVVVGIGLLRLRIPSVLVSERIVSRLKSRLSHSCPGA